MKFLESMIAWNNGGSIDVGPWPDRIGWTKEYDKTWGACNFDTHGLSDFELATAIFTNFHAIVVRDGVDPIKAHKAFLKIDEYRPWIAPDIEGAEG